MPYSKDHKAKSKQKIINSAKDLFFRYGFEKVSISQIMKVARMTHGAFYAHFESKEALYNASFIDTLRESRAARLAKGPFTVKHLMSLITDYLNLRELERKPIPGPESVLFTEIGSSNPEIRKLYETSYLSLKRMIEIRITALIRLKKLPITADRETVADKSRAILASLVGAVAIAKSLPQEDEQRRILAAAQRQILTMLGVSERDFDDFSRQIR